jgi:flagellar protein FlaI
MKNTKIDQYEVASDEVRCNVSIYEVPEEYVPIYEIDYPHVEKATEVVLQYLREKLVETVTVQVSEILDPKQSEIIKKRFKDSTKALIAKEFPELSKTAKDTLTGMLVHEMLGLGKLELILADPNLEEIVINNAKEPVWVYHKKHGWLKTNVNVPTEEQIFNYASIIGRKIGRQITNLNPLMDAHLLSGDRVNATLFPISSAGNTITIRKFARNPWTIINFIDPSIKTLTAELAALVWLCMEYELNIVVSGGTASGKTSMLNAILPFIPPTHRVISIEDTRELTLPDFLHWVPLTTREPNPEGKGEVTMLDLMVNSLRMRPDRIVLGEIRRQREAEVLFEAMHTGHSVYSTLHADTADQVTQRLTNPPIELPESMLEALHLILVQYRHRRLKIRRTFEVAEVIPTYGKDGKATIGVNVLYRWKPKNDKIEKLHESIRLFKEIELHTGMTSKEIRDDLDKKEMILNWMLKNKINTVNTVGKIIADYYDDKAKVVEIARKGKKPSELLDESLMREIV